MIKYDKATINSIIFKKQECLPNENFLKNSPCKIIALVKNSEHAKIRFSNYLNDKNFSLLIQDVSSKINLNVDVELVYIKTIIYRTKNQGK